MLVHLSTLSDFLAVSSKSTDSFWRQNLLKTQIYSLFPLFWSLESPNKQNTSIYNEADEPLVCQILIKIVDD